MVLHILRIFWRFTKYSVTKLAMCGFTLTCITSKLLPINGAKSSTWFWKNFFYVSTRVHSSPINQHKVLTSVYRNTFPSRDYYINEKCCSMLITYGMANESANVARELYLQKFLKWTIPDAAIFPRLLHRARTTESLGPKHGRDGDRLHCYDVRVWEAILDTMEDVPSLSIRETLL